MPKTVIGLMENETQIQDVIRELTENGIPRERIDLQGADSGDRAGVLDQGLRRGGTLVVVTVDSQAEADRATAAMRRAGTVEIRERASGPKREVETRTHIGTGEDTVHDAAIPVLREEIDPGSQRVPAAAMGQGPGNGRLHGGWDGKDRRMGGVGGGLRSAERRRVS